MGDEDLIRILSSATVVLLFITMNYLYKDRFKENIEENENKVNITGLLIFVASIALAVIWLWTE
jgi:hypothetical protein